MLYLEGERQKQFPETLRATRERGQDVLCQHLLSKSATWAEHLPLKHKPETAEVFILQILCAKHLTRGPVKVGAVESSPLWAADF